jgi:hypothetical protein
LVLYFEILYNIIPVFNLSNTSSIPLCPISFAQ